MIFAELKSLSYSRQCSWAIAMAAPCWAEKEWRPFLPELNTAAMTVYNSSLLAANSYCSCMKGLEGSGAPCFQSQTQQPKRLVGGSRSRSSPRESNQSVYHQVSNLIIKTELCTFDHECIDWVSTSKTSKFVLSSKFSPLYPQTKKISWMHCHIYLLVRNECCMISLWISLWILNLCCMAALTSQTWLFCMLQLLLHPKTLVWVLYSPAVQFDALLLLFSAPPSTLHDCLQHTQWVCPHNNGSNILPDSVKWYTLCCSTNENPLQVTEAEYFEKHNGRQQGQLFVIYNLATEGCKYHICVFVHVRITLKDVHARFSAPWHKNMPKGTICTKLRCASNGL